VNCITPRISRRVETAFEGMSGWKLLWSLMRLSTVDRLANVIARDNAVGVVVS
jgi:hypothetical protein